MTRSVPKQVLDPAGRKRRRQTLTALGGFWPFEIEDLSIGGRTRVIRILEEQAVTQLRIKQDAPHYYSEDLHIRILKALSDERKAVDAMTRGLPKNHPMMQLRLVP